MHALLRAMQTLCPCYLSKGPIAWNHVLNAILAAMILLPGASGAKCRGQAPRAAIIALAPDLNHAHDIAILKEALQHATNCWKTNCTNYRTFRTMRDIAAGPQQGLMPNDKNLPLTQQRAYFGSTLVKWEMGTVLWSAIMNQTHRMHQAQSGMAECFPVDVRAPCALVVALCMI